jgi:hypothetical protein
MKRWAFVALFLVGACATPQKDVHPLNPEEKLAAARDLARLTVTPERVERSARAYVNEYRSRFPTPAVVCKTAKNMEACETTDRKLLTEVDALLDEYVSKRRAQTPQLMEMQARRFADVYSDDEIAAAKAFYVSPAGHSILNKSEVLTEESAKDQYDLMRPLGDQLSKDLRMRSLALSGEFAKSFGGSPTPPTTPATPS